MNKKITALLLALVMVLSTVPVVFGAENDGINLYFVRHGKTILNTLGKAQGWSDSPLTTDGRETAYDTAFGLADIKFDSVYSSDKLRAVETAEIILSENIFTDPAIEIVEMEGLREFNFGKWEGEPNDILWGVPMADLGAAHMGELFIHPIEDIYGAWSANDETGQAEPYDVYMDRLMTSVDKIVKEAVARGDKNVLITGHGMAISSIMTELDEDKTVYGELPNASISVAKYKDGKYETVTVGDTSFTEKGAEIRNAEVVIYLARHGKTLFNTVGKTQGWVDSPLTDEGKAIAENLGKGLAGIDFTAAYSSDLGRAADTAQLVLKHNASNLEITKLEGLRETYMGSFEAGVNNDMLAVALEKMGLTGFDDPKAAEYENFLKSMTDAIAEAGGGETYNELSARVNEAMKQIANEVKYAGGGNVLVVSHGNAIMAFMADHGVTVPSGQIGNASVQKIIYKDGVFTVESYDDMSYAENGALR